MFVREDGTEVSAITIILSITVADPGGLLGSDDPPPNSTHPKTNVMK